MSYKENIKKLYFFKFLKSLYFFSGVLIPFFTAWGGISFFQIMILQSWFVIWEMVLEIPTGAIADYFGRKISVAFGAFVNVIAVVVYSSYPSFYVFLAGEFLWALATALISGADDALLYDSLRELKEEKNSKKVIGRFESFELLGIVIATPVGSVIAATFGLKYAVLAMSVPLFVSFLVALSIKEPHYKRKDKTQNYIKTMKEGIRYFYNHKILRILAFDSVAVGALSFFAIWLYQPLMQQLNLPLAYFGLIHSAGALFEIFVLNNFLTFERILKSKQRYLFLSALSVGIGYLFLSISSSIILSVFLVVLIFGFGLTRNVAIVNYMHKYIKSDKRATVLSSVTMLFSLGRAVLYLLVGLLVQYSLNITLFLLGILVIITAVFSRVEEHMLID
jgi:MFS family permease